MHRAIIFLIFLFADRFKATADIVEIKRLFLEAALQGALNAASEYLHYHRPHDTDRKHYYKHHGVVHYRLEFKHIVEVKN
jgi:hypothetical protein